MTDTRARGRQRHLEQIWQAAVDAVGGRAAVRLALDADSPFVPDLVVAVGKAASGMCIGALERFPDAEALVVTKYDHADPVLVANPRVELIESARLEGVDEFRIFWHLVLPLVRPAIAALSVLIFTFIWNDFIWATVMLQDDSKLPITVGVRTLNGEFRQQWQLVSAASLLAAVPPVIVFFLMQKHFIAGLTMGATKG